MEQRDRAKITDHLVAGIRTLLDSRQRRLAALLVAGLLFGALLEMVAIGAIPAFVGLLHDPVHLLNILPNFALTRQIRKMDPANLILVGAAILAALFLLKNLYTVVLIYAEAFVHRDILISVSNRLFRAYLYCPYTFHLQRNPAHLIRNIGSETDAAVGLLRSVAMMLREGLVVFVVFLLLLIVDPLISLLVVALLAIPAGGFYLAMRQNLLRRGALAQHHRARQAQILSQGIGAIKEAKVLGRQPHLIDLFRLETKGVQQHELYSKVASSMPRPYLEVVAMAAVLLVATVFVLLGRPPQAIMPVLAVLAVGVVRLVPAFNVITASLGGIRYARPAFNLICDELAALEIFTPAIERTEAIFDKFQSSINLIGVHYSYPGAKAEALCGISLTIEAGKAVAFIGPSGSGKSTIVDLILGLLAPTVGAIHIDGRDLKRTLTPWQRQIGYVPQDIYLIDDSIRRNIAFGLPDEEINEVALTRAVRAAQLESFLLTLPDGLNAIVGNRGIRLSGGQRQRIGIARALYHEPRVLVMDEATNALDVETECEVIRAINQLRGDRTILMIAHRLTTVMGCDRIYLLEAGLLKDAGSYAELMRRHEQLRPPSDIEAFQLAATDCN